MRPRGWLADLLSGSCLPESPTIRIAVCLSLTSDPGEEKEIDFPQKPNAPAVTPGIPRTKNLGERIDFSNARELAAAITAMCKTGHAARPAAGYARRLGEVGMMFKVCLKFAGLRATLP